MHRIRLIARQLHTQTLSHSHSHLGQVARMSTNIPQSQKALQIHSQGGLEVLAIHDIPVPKPKADEILIKVEYSGVNYIDTYLRSGLYPRDMPFILGNEAAGTVMEVGADQKSNGISVGDRIASYSGGGGFAEYASLPRRSIYKLPEGVDTKLGAAATLQGLTAWTMIKESYPLKKGDWVLVHAAAGGVGLLLCQMASHLGAHVIGTASTAEKVELAKNNGAEHVINYAQESIVDKVLELTGGKGVQGIYDGVGKDTWEDDFKVIARKGTIVTFGNASGAVEPFTPLKLAAKNVKVCRPTLFNYVTTQEEMEYYCKELFDLIAQGVVKVKIHEEYEFSAEGVRKSQEDITSRKTTGKLVIKIAQ